MKVNMAKDMAHEVPSPPSLGDVWHVKRKAKKIKAWQTRHWTCQGTLKLRPMEDVLTYLKSTLSMQCLMKLEVCLGREEDV